jgi:outer membrane protein assembly factor BamB
MRAVRRWWTVVVALGVTALLGGCSWAQFQHDPAHSGANPAEGTIDLQNVGGLHEVWTAASGAVTSTPVVSDGLVYVGTASNRLVAYDADGVDGCSGAPVVCTPSWRSGNLFGAIVGSPAVAGGVVYAAGVSQRLYAFDAKGGANCTGTPLTCTPLWTATLGGEARASVTVADGRVFVSAIVGFDHVLYAFDAAGVTGCSGAPKTCTPLWTASAPIVSLATAGRATPAVADGRVYMAFGAQPADDDSGAAAVLAFDAAGQVGCSGSPTTCSPLFSGRTDGASVLSSASVVNGVVYASADDGLLYTFDASGAHGCAGTPKVCAPLWTASIGPADPQDNAGVAVADGTVLAGGSNGISAFDATGSVDCGGVPKTCTALWTTSIGSERAPSVAGRVLFATSGSGIAAVDASGATGCSGLPKTCAPLWSAAGGFGISVPSVVLGRVYVGSSDGKLHVFALP